MTLEGLLKIDLTPVKPEASADSAVQSISLNTTQVQEATSKVVAKVLNTRDSEQVLPASIQDLKVQIEQKLASLIAASPEGQVIELSAEIIDLIVNFNKLQELYLNLKGTLTNLQTELDLLHSNVIALVAKNAELQPLIARYREHSDQHERNETEITDKQAKIAKKTSLQEKLTALLNSISLENLPEIEKSLRESNLKFAPQAPKSRVSSLVVRVPELPVISPRSSFSTIPESLEGEPETAATPEAHKGILAKKWAEFMSLPFSKQLTVAIAMSLPGAVSFFAISVNNFYDNTPAVTSAPTSTTPQDETSSNSEFGQGDFSVTNFESTVMQNNPEMNLEEASPNFIRLVNIYNDHRLNAVMELVLLELAYDFVARLPDLESREHEFTFTIRKPRELTINGLASPFNINWNDFTYSITFNPSTLDFVFTVIDGDDMDSSFRIELEGRFEHEEAQ